MRKDEIDREEWKRLRPLQWGRNMRVAESKRALRAGKIGAHLQWGRNMRVAESTS